MSSGKQDNSTSKQEKHSKGDKPKSKSFLHSFKRKLRLTDAAEPTSKPTVPVDLPASTPEKTSIAEVTTSKVEEDGSTLNFSFQTNL